MAKQKVIEGALAALGDRVEDKITGFVGIVTGIARYISGCDQVSVSARVKEDSEEPKHLWFDIGRAGVIEQGAVPPVSVMAPLPGGPQNSPAKG